MRIEDRRLEAQVILLILLVFMVCFYNPIVIKLEASTITTEEVAQAAAYTCDNEWDKNLSKNSPDRMNCQIPNLTQNIRENVEETFNQYGELRVPNDLYNLKGKTEESKYYYLPMVDPFMGEWSDISYSNVDIAAQEAIMDAVMSMVGGIAALSIGVAVGTAVLMAVLTAASGGTILIIAAAAGILSAAIATTYAMNTTTVDSITAEVVSQVEDIDLDDAYIEKNNVVYGKGLKYNEFVNSNLMFVASEIATDLDGASPAPAAPARLDGGTDFNFTYNDTNLTVDLSNHYDEIIERHYFRDVYEEDEFGDWYFIETIEITEEEYTSYAGQNVWMTEEIYYLLNDAEGAYEEIQKIAYSTLIDGDLMNQTVYNNLRISNSIESRYGMKRIKGAVYDSKGMITAYNGGDTIVWYSTGLKSERSIPACARNNTSCIQKAKDPRMYETPLQGAFAFESFNYAVSNSLYDGVKTIDTNAKDAYETVKTAVSKLQFMLPVAVIATVILSLSDLYKRRVKSIMIGILLAAIAIGLVSTNAGVNALNDIHETAIRTYSGTKNVSGPDYAFKEILIERYKMNTLDGNLTDAEAKAFLSKGGDMAYAKKVDKLAKENKTIQISGSQYLWNNFWYNMQALLVFFTSLTISFAKPVYVILTLLIAYNLVLRKNKKALELAIFAIAYTFGPLMAVDIVQLLPVMIGSIISLIIIAISVIKIGKLVNKGYRKITEPKRKVGNTYRKFKRDFGTDDIMEAGRDIKDAAESAKAKAERAGQSVADIKEKHFQTAYGEMALNYTDQGKEEAAMVQQAIAIVEAEDIIDEIYAGNIDLSEARRLVTVSKLLPPELEQECREVIDHRIRKARRIKEIGRALEKGKATKEHKEELEKINEVLWTKAGNGDLLWESEQLIKRM